MLQVTDVVAGYGRGVSCATSRCPSRTARSSECSAATAWARAP